MRCAKPRATPFAPTRSAAWCAQLYDWPHFATFLAATMGKDRLYTMADKLAAVNAMTYREGEALNWHFDRSEFTTTLLLQAPDRRRRLRIPHRPAQRFRSQLRWRRPPAARPRPRVCNPSPSSPARSTCFAGKNTAHRVTPVQGNTNRIITVFSFFDRPGVVFTPEEQIGFYGRAA
ncbi:MAG: hypothetical protein V9G14_07670 [Cypionkella sp.]